MEKLRKFLRLSLSDQFFLIKSICLVALIRLGLSILPFRVVKKWLDQISTAKDRQPRQFDPSIAAKIAHTVKVTSRYIPEATCLTQAFAAQVLLARRGYTAELKIGVAKGSDSRLKAHAWVERKWRVYRNWGRG